MAFSKNVDLYINLDNFKQPLIACVGLFALFSTCHQYYHKSGGRIVTSPGLACFIVNLFHLTAEHQIRIDLRYKNKTFLRIFMPFCPFSLTPNITSSKVDETGKSPPSNLPSA
jgi:hypothetical protein